jgi:Rod binding domain-containing protein
MTDPLSTAAAIPLLPAPLARPKDAADAARQFEALLLAQMLRGVHESSQGLLDEERDATTDTLWDVAAQQFAQLLAERGGLGLARLIEKGLVPQR